MYAFGGYRILPALQQSYNSITSLRYSGPALDNLCEELKLNKKVLSENDNIESLTVKSVISLKEVSYKYPNTDKSSIENINLDILAYSTVGLVGSTGSGKTSTADVILGLLEPQKGELNVDGKTINDQNRRSGNQVYRICSASFIF